MVKKEMENLQWAGPGTVESQRTGAEYAKLEGSEIKSLREERAKHYDLGRGRRQAVMYSAPVHYRSKGFIARNPGSS